MSIIYKQIPNMAAAISLGGEEELEIVQAGTSMRTSINMVSDLVLLRSGITLTFAMPLLRVGTNVVLTTVPVGQGGTGATTLALNSLLVGNGADPVNTVSPGVTGQILAGVTGGPPTWQTVGGSGGVSLVTSFSAGTTGLTPSTPTSSAVVLGGILEVDNGGTGANLGATGGPSQVLKQTTAGGNVTVGQLAASDISGMPTALPPSGTASGDLAGSYPGPTIKANVVLTGNPTLQTAPPIDDNDLSIPTTGWVQKELLDGLTALPRVTSLTPGSGITMTPNPITATGTIAFDSSVLPTSLPPSGLAGGDLTGTYPNPTIKTNVILGGDPTLSTVLNPADNDQSIATTKFVKDQGYATTTSVTTALAGYLPLTGGSLAGPGNLLVGGTLGVTGALTGTTATFSGQINASLAQISSATKGIRLVPGTTNSTIMGTDQTGTGSYQPLAIDTLSLGFNLSGVQKALLDSTGFTLATPLTGTTATMSGTVSTNHLTVKSPASAVIELDDTDTAVKKFLTNDNGVFSVVNSAFSAFLFTVNDVGIATLSGTIPPSSNDTTVPTTAWVKANAGGGGSASISVGATPPGSPTDGAMWFNSDASSGGGTLYIRYNDGNSTAWVPASPNATVTPGPYLSTVGGTLTGPLRVGYATGVPITANVGISYTPSVQVASTSVDGYSAIRYGGGLAALFAFAKSGGALGAHGLPSGSADLGKITFNASDGTQFVEGAYIAATLDTTPAVGSMPTKLTFNVTPSGATIPAEALRINNDKSATFGGTLTVNGASSGTQLKVIGNDTATPQVLYSGLTKGVRYTFNSAGSVIEGVDNTGVTSYQPLTISGSTVSFPTQVFFTQPITTSYGSPSAGGLSFTAAAGNYRYTEYKSGALLRWQIGVDNSAEGGSNAGSDLFVNIFNDAGTYTATPLKISRATGAATFASTVFAPGAQIQMVSTQTGAVATGTTVIPFDDTIPQITEGDQYMTLAITPKSATSKLIINVVAMLTTTLPTGNGMTAVLFQDSNVNGLATALSPVTSTIPMTISFRHVMTSGTTSATTFRVRAGGNAAGTTTFNGSGGLRNYGGTYASSIVITEVA